MTIRIAKLVMAVWIKSVVFFFFVFLVCLAHGQGLDMTLQSGASGADVVRSVQSRLENSNIFNAPAAVTEWQAYELFVREMAFVESQDGTLGVQNGGIWRISQKIFKQTQQLDLNEIFDRICRIFCISWRDIGYDDLSRPLYSGLAVSIYLHHLYLTNQSSLQGASTDMDRALFWDVSFGEFRDTSQWLMRIEQLREIEGNQMHAQP